MNNNNHKYLFETDYFHRPWTWIRRIAMILVVFVAVILLNVDDGTQLVKPILVTLFAFCLLVKRKDDVAINVECFYHIKRSLLPSLSKIDQYELKELTSIRCSGIHTDAWELVDFFNGPGRTGGYSNKVEMIFKDGSSKSLNLRISRKNLNKIVHLAYKANKGIESEINKISCQDT